MTTELRIDQRSRSRRGHLERRDDHKETFDGAEQRKAPRRKAERRRQIDPTTCERDYSELEVEFMRAIDDYKRKSGRMFPTWSEVLEVVHSLGYRKVAESTELTGYKMR